MSSPAQRKATQNYRKRLAQQGIVRFEVLAPEHDRALFRALARQLSDSGPEAQKVRLAIQKILSGEPAKTVPLPQRRSSPAEKQPSFSDLFDSSS